MGVILMGFLDDYGMSMLLKRKNNYYLVNWSVGNCIIWANKPFYLISIEKTSTRCSIWIYYFQTMFLLEIYLITEV